MTFFEVEYMKEISTCIIDTKSGLLVEETKTMHLKEEDVKVRVQQTIRVQ